MMDSVLSEKEKRFCSRYVLHLNASKAAREAGYSTKNSDVIGSQLLQKASIIKEIQVYKKQLNETYQIESEEVLWRLATLARSSIGNILDDDLKIKKLSALSVQEQYMIEEIKITEFKGQKTTALKLRSPMKSLEILSKLLLTQNNGELAETQRNKKLVLDRVSELLNKYKTYKASLKTE